MNFLKKVAKKALRHYGSSNGRGEVFLHGHLFLAINAARDLPDMESWIAKLYDKKDVTDPYVDVHLDGRIVKTTILMNTLDPVWNESYRLEVRNT